MKVLRLVSLGIVLGLLAGCLAPHATRTGGNDGLTGDARDRQLLLSGTGDYLKAKFGPDFFGMRRKMLLHAKALFEEVLSDDAASPKSKREAADMLSKVNARLAER